MKATLRLGALVLALAGTTWRASAGDVEIWGRSIQDWFDEGPGETMSDPWATDAILALGTNAVPFLIDVLNRRAKSIAWPAG